MNFSLVCFGVFSGFSETKNGENKDIFYFWGCMASRCGSLFVAVVVSTSADVSGFRGCPLFMWCAPAFCPLPRFTLVLSLANMALFRVLKAFLARFYGVRVGLCCLGCFAWLVWLLCA